MTGHDVLGGKERKFVRGVLIAVFTAWFLVGLLPVIALVTPVFRVRTDAEVERVKSVLQQFGTYGDMFGLLNCLFSGLALAGVAYAIVLQIRDLDNQRRDMGRNARASELQNRLAAYQSLADHHRYQRDNARSDILLEARSRGRERAYAELMKVVLLEIEAHAAGRDAPETTRLYDEHAARVRNLRNRYREDRTSVTNAADPFGPVQQHLLDLVEEVAALTEMVRNNLAVDSLLLQAGHAVNAAVQPEEAMGQPESSPEQIRDYQIGAADEAFQAAIEAVRALGYAIP